ncbi:MAG TPA: trypsin-like peptidase domain-containing protein [Gemmataceae bacterium]|nr:trypsin-like peptidase domain-containing protein [Gemmataceae bacterium]
MLKRAALILFVGACAFGGGMAAVLLGPRLTSAASAQVVVPGPGSGSVDLPRTSDRFEAVARKVMPAVVAVEAKKPAGGKRTKAEEESGSGVLIKAEGQRGVLVLTNNHVIAEAALKDITISLADDRIAKPAQVWADPESDVALLRLEGLDGAATAPLGDSDGVRVGQWVLAFGSPFGLNQSMTHGIISARERGQVGLGSTIRIKDFLQTDAAINPGSSGGPLVNLDGEVIGLNTAIASHSNSSSGVAFSIPINLVKRVMKQLLEKGSVARGYLGMQLAESFEAVDALRLGLDRVQGALVETVFADTPASAAGLKPKDVVLQVDETTIRNENHLINLITATPAGQKVRLQVWRDKRTMALDAVVGDWSKGQGRFRPAQ